MNKVDKGSQFIAIGAMFSAFLYFTQLQVFWDSTSFWSFILSCFAHYSLMHLGLNVVGCILLISFWQGTRSYVEGYSILFWILAPTFLLNFYNFGLIKYGGFSVVLYAGFFDLMCSIWIKFRRKSVIVIGGCLILKTFLELLSIIPRSHYGEYSVASGVHLYGIICGCATAWMRSKKGSRSFLLD